MALCTSANVLCPIFDVLDFLRDPRYRGHKNLFRARAAHHASVWLEGLETRAVNATASLDELRGKLIGLLQAPATKLAVLLQTPGGQLARVLAAYSEQNGESASEPVASPE